MGGSASLHIALNYMMSGETLKDDVITQNIKIGNRMEEGGLKSMKGGMYSRTFSMMSV